jgi:phage terminase large subunit-like protein
MTQWMSAQKWNACIDPELKIEDCIEMPGYIALDLASNLDLCSAAILFRDGTDYKLFAKNYINRRAVDEAKDAQRLNYLEWAKRGDLTITETETTDYQVIEQDIRELLETHNIQAVGYDPYQSNYLITNLDNSGVKVIKVPQQVATLSQPMKNVERFTFEKKLTHNNKVLTWCMGNIIAREDRKQNIFPNKDRNYPSKKIDAGVASIMAFALELANPLPTTPKITGQLWELT